MESDNLEKNHLETLRKGPLAFDLSKPSSRLSLLRVHESVTGAEIKASMMRVWLVGTDLRHEYLLHSFLQVVGMAIDSRLKLDNGS